MCTTALADRGLPAAQVGPWRALVGGACFAVHAVVRRALAKGVGARGGLVPGGAVRGDGVPGGGSGGGPVSLRGSIAGVARHWVAAVGFCVLGVVVFYAALPLAVETGGISLAYVLLYTAPLWVAAGSVLWLGERLDPRGVAAIVAAVGGVAAVAASAGGTVEVSVTSVAWGLVAGASYASYYLLGRRLFVATDAVVLYALVLPAGGIVLVAIVGIGATASMLPWLLVLGVACTYLPYLLFSIGVRRVPSNRAVVVAMVEPVVATALGIAFYGERLGVLGFLGAAVVLAAATVTALRR